MPSVSTDLAHTLLRRIVAQDRGDRFQLAELCPADGAKMLTVFEVLVETGFIERVVEGCGRWFYRLTSKGWTAATAATPPKIHVRDRDRDEDE